MFVIAGLSVIFSHGTEHTSFRNPHSTYTGEDGRWLSCNVKLVKSSLSREGRGGNKHPSRDLTKLVKLRRIVDQDLLANRGIRRPYRQLVQYPAVVDLEQWRHVGRLACRAA